MPDAHTHRETRRTRTTEKERARETGRQRDVETQRAKVRDTESAKEMERQREIQQVRDGGRRGEERVQEAYIVDACLDSVRVQVKVHFAGDKDHAANLIVGHLKPNTSKGAETRHVWSTLEQTHHKGCVSGELDTLHVSDIYVRTYD